MENGTYGDLCAPSATLIFVLLVSPWVFQYNNYSSGVPFHVYPQRAISKRFFYSGTFLSRC